MRPSKGRRSETSLVSRKALTAALCWPTREAVSKSGSFRSIAPRVVNRGHVARSLVGDFPDPALALGELLFAEEARNRSGETPASFAASA